MPCYLAIQLRGHNHNYEPTGENDITSSHFSENHEVSGGDDNSHYLA
jgi:hypothetical protein